MSVTLAILLVGLLAGGLLVAASFAGRTRRPSDVTDVEVPDRWLVSAVRRWPGVQRAARSVDRRVWGGVVLAVGFAIVFAVALLVGWIFSTIDSGRGVAQWDESVAQWGSDNADSASIDVVRAVTELGGTPLLVIVMIVIGLVEWRRRGDATSLWFLLAVGVGVTAVNNLLKLLIMRDRPSVEHLMDPAGSSFPSGHSAAAAACWMAIALVVGRWVPRSVRPWVAALAVTIAFAVAASRALLGVSEGSSHAVALRAPAKTLATPRPPAGRAMPTRSSATTATSSVSSEPTTSPARTTSASTTIPTGR